MLLAPTARAATPRASRYACAVVCWAPLIAFGAVLGFALLASLKVGHWPWYSSPDPKDLRLPLLHVAALLSYPLALLSVPTGLLLTLVAWDSLRRRDVIVFTVGASLWVFNLPVAGQLLDWLLD